MMESKSTVIILGTPIDNVVCRGTIEHAHRPDWLQFNAGLFSIKSIFCLGIFSLLHLHASHSSAQGIRILCALLRI